MNREQRRILIQAGLFVTTFITTTFAGTEWTYGKSILFSPDYSWQDFQRGFAYSIPLLLILTVHEFGHYFTALYHKIKSSLPWYIPVPPGFLSIGTFGAVIRIRSKVHSNIQHFDIGIAGPLAGFVVAVAVLFYGFKTLPPPDYIYQFHPEYESFGPAYAEHVYSEEYLREHQQFDIILGNSLLFMFFEKFVGEADRIPNHHELMHYPILMAGLIALFFTSLNLLPIGQLDGGHVIYGLFGEKGHRVIATVFYVLLLLYSGLGFVDLQSDKADLSWIIPFGVLFYFLCLQGLRLPARDTIMYSLLLVAFILFMAWMFPHVKGYSGWLLIAFLIGRLLGVHHPPTEIEQPLDPARQLLGWICLIVFVISFSPAPLEMIEAPLPE